MIDLTLRPGESCPHHAIVVLVDRKLAPILFRLQHEDLSHVRSSRRTTGPGATETPIRRILLHDQTQLTALWGLHGRLDDTFAYFAKLSFHRMDRARNQYI